MASGDFSFPLVVGKYPNPPSKDRAIICLLCSVMLVIFPWHLRLLSQRAVLSALTCDKLRHSLMNPQVLGSVNPLKVFAELCVCARLWFCFVLFC